MSQSRTEKPKFTRSTQKLSQLLLLLSFTGANINAKDQGLLTPLHRAAASRNEVCSYFKTQREKGFLKELTTQL